ncbi:2-hydroxychromene-2-carboxylate isomerase [Herbaspirillum sp. YR522]|uniref:2-hydroxychromene-2-carboxylate isomerase n=1 Tax=Herbaspirillum sp. YR522 TaxID=1144342 RepID=UPI00026FAB8B|nr:2-hydroxychromene-2-carboxylate isomerase [Herbaspirillum sp. YR522]EJM95844.1 2-hydroxychromene-2-carboxylate isomerase [Herbaspirillum sp. YR522]
MSTPIDFYFDFASPYAYFGSLEIEALARRHERQVAWHPVLLGAVFKTLGTSPLTAIPKKGDYSLHDMQRTARFHNMLFTPPSKFPIATQAAARAMLWLQQQDPQHALPFAQAIFSAYFTEDIDIGEPDNVLRIAADLGIDRAALTAALADPAVKDRLRQATEQAMQRGVFGAPFVIVDGESFWGFDRFNQLESFLKNGKI